MANEYEELKQVLQHLLNNRFVPKPKLMHGVLGDGQGNVKVPGRPDKSFVRFNRGSTEYFEIFNVTVEPVHDWPVLIGQKFEQPGLTQIVGTDWAAYEQGGWGDKIGQTSPHAPTHAWPDGQPGSDPLDIYLRAIVPFRAWALGSGSSKVFVNAYEYDPSGTVWGGLPGVDLQPVMSATTTGTMRYAGIYLDITSNTLGVVTGTTTVHSPALKPPRVAFPIGTIPSARVRIYGGQDGINDADIFDARRPFAAWPTGTGGGGAPSGDAGGDLTGSYPNPQVAGLFGYSLLSTTPSEGNVLMFTGSAWRPIPGISGYPFDVIKVDATDPDADHATVTAAEAAASAGNTILVGPATYEETLTIDVAITLKGVSSRERAILFKDDTLLPWQVTAGAIVENLKFDNTADGLTGTTTGLYINGGHNAEIRDVISQCVQTNHSSDPVYGIASAATGTVLQNCFVPSGTNDGGDGRALGVLTGDATIRDGYFNGQDADVYLEDGVTVHFDGPTLENDTIEDAGTSTKTGWYIRGADGKIVRLDDGVRAPAENIWRNGASLSDSDFVATINGAPSGTSVVYNAPSAGDENNLPVNSTGQLAKMVLHNTTRGNSALISDCNTGTNTITLTATVPGDWASTDTITIRSQTNTSAIGGTVYFVDFEFTSEITFETGFLSQWTITDSTGQARIWLHPFETNTSQKRRNLAGQVGNTQFYGLVGPISVISSRFCLAWEASGAGNLDTLIGQLTKVEY